MSRSASSMCRVARARSSSRSVSADIRREMSTHARRRSLERSRVYARPSRCSSKTRMPMPRSPRAITASTAPSLISTDPDWASRRKTSPVAPLALSALRAASTVASLVSRSLIWWTRLAGGTGERVVREPRVPRGPTTRSERSERRDGWGGGGERATPSRGQDPPACPWVRRSLQFSTNDDAPDADRRLCVGDRRALAIFAASPSGVAEIGADHVDLAHELGALADERRPSERLGELAIADPVALGDLECEVSRHDIHLPAAHFFDEHAFFDRPQDFGGI